MRSKRLLTLLLVLCMVVSTLAPAAHAANWTKGGPVQSQDAAPTNPAAAEKAPAGALNLRDNPLTKEDAEETSEVKGQWNATALEDAPASLTLLWLNQISRSTSNCFCISNTLLLNFWVERLYSLTKLSRKQLFRFLGYHFVSLTHNYI